MKSHVAFYVHRLKAMSMVFGKDLLWRLKLLLGLLKLLLRRHLALLLLSALLCLLRFLLPALFNELTLVMEYKSCHYVKRIVFA